MPEQLKGRRRVNADVGGFKQAQTEIEVDRRRRGQVGAGQMEVVVVPWSHLGVTTDSPANWRGEPRFCTAMLANSPNVNPWIMGVDPADKRLEVRVRQGLPCGGRRVGTVNTSTSTPASAQASMTSMTCSRTCKNAPTSWMSKRPRRCLSLGWLRLAVGPVRL